MSADAAPCRPSPPGHRFLELFRTTPANTVCPNFFVLDHAHGCTFRPLCRYCYLKDGVYDMTPFAYGDRAALLAEVSAWIADDGHEVFLANAGNLSDSFAFEDRRPLAADLVDLFRREAEAAGKPHTLLFVTKGARREAAALDGLAPCRNVIVSFSVNAAEAARDHERGAPAPAERLDFAARLQEKGWRVRVRLDPMMVGYGYGEVVEDLRRLAPERVTLGTLRADPPLAPRLPESLRRPLSPPEAKGGLWRYPRADRLALYGPAVEGLRGTATLALCEETPDVWLALGLDPERKACNCLPDRPGHP